jgi:hypothetical protein
VYYLIKAGRPYESSVLHSLFFPSEEDFADKKSQWLTKDARDKGPRSMSTTLCTRTELPKSATLRCCPAWMISLIRKRSKPHRSIPRVKFHGWSHIASFIRLVELVMPKLLTYIIYWSNTNFKKPPKEAPWLPKVPVGWRCNGRVRAQELQQRRIRTLTETYRYMAANSGEMRSRCLQQHSRLAFPPSHHLHRSAFFQLVCPGFEP